MKAENVKPGMRFGKLTVLHEYEKIGNKYRCLCLCDCGNQKYIDVYSLLGGNSKSCGCAKSEYVRNWQERNFSLPEGAVRFDSCRKKFLVLMSPCSVNPEIKPLVRLRCGLCWFDAKSIEQGSSTPDWMVKRIRAVSCANCQKTFLQHPYRIKRSKFLYCSSSCFYEHKAARKLKKRRTLDYNSIASLKMRGATDQQIALMFKCHKSTIPRVMRKWKKERTASDS